MPAPNAYKLDPKLPKPLYEQLAEKILARVRRGEYKAGKPLPPINSLERMVNASRITVVRALKELAGQGVITAHGTRGYYVNPLGDPLQVGMIVPLHTVFLSIYGKMHAALQLAVRRHFGRLVVASSEEDPRVFRERLREMTFGQGIRKLAVVPPAAEGPGLNAHPDAVEVLREIAAVPGMRLVAMDRHLEPQGFSVLEQNRESGYRQALVLLAGLGYRNLVFLNPHPALAVARAAMAEQLQGVTVREAHLPQLSQQEIMEQALAAAADAVVVGDLAAALLLEHFGTLPFALVGYDGSDFVDACPVRLTHVDSNLREMGRAAFSILETGQTDVHRLIDACIRMGDTTPRVPLPAPGTVAAVRATR